MQGIPVPASCVTATCHCQRPRRRSGSAARRPDGTACNATSATYNALAVSGATAIVKVTYNHTLITPFISSVLGDVVTLDQSTQMRVE